MDIYPANFGHRVIKIKNKQKKYNTKAKNPRHEMSDKQKLLESMSNLIHHISSNPSKREQIFSTLSAQDLKKMLANLEDENENVRKITLTLLAEFMFQNYWTQGRFCEMTGIPEIQGKVVLTGKFPRLLLNDRAAMKEVFEILKLSSNFEQKGLFWYIDSRLKNKSLLIGRRNTQSADPLYCIVGVWLKGKQKQQKKEIFHWKNFVVPDKTPTHFKGKMSQSFNYEKDFGSEFIPETPTKSSLTDEPIMTKSLNYNNYVQPFSTPVRSKLNSTMLSKTQPISMPNPSTHPISTLHSPTLIKKPYSQAPTNYQMSYQISPMPSGQKSNPQKSETERKPAYQILIPGTPYYRQDYKRI